MRKKILLVDDMELILELEKTFFWRVEIELLLARDGEEALRVVRETKPDLVFLDLHMPGMAGDECCRRIKEDPLLRGVPVVMLPYEGREEDLRRCREAKCDTVVFKPINRHYFVATARKFLHLTTRAAVRVPARLEINFGSGESEMLRNPTVNISSGGVFIETREVRPIDTDLELVFDLPEMREGIGCQARVAWVNPPASLVKPLMPPGMGVQFLDLTLAQMEALFAFVKKKFLRPG